MKKNKFFSFLSRQLVLIGIASFMLSGPALVLEDFLDIEEVACVLESDMDQESEKILESIELLLIESHWVTNSKINKKPLYVYESFVVDTSPPPES
ncbi:hypothetical protein [Flavicella sediminum]|uniref:hypothetical protein n=1 Tax=Flavicella sediminum TaxID=2585141 RepID=UPI00111CFEBA|nr:hypothetical protein [Flavicella sediminum]